MSILLHVQFARHSKETCMLGTLAMRVTSFVIHTAISCWICNVRWAVGLQGTSASSSSNSSCPLRKTTCAQSHNRSTCPTLPRRCLQCRP